jgi:hypothetical protein
MAELRVIGPGEDTVDGQSVGRHRHGVQYRPRRSIRAKGSNGTGGPFGALGNYFRCGHPARVGVPDELESPRRAINSHASDSTLRGLRCLLHCGRLSAPARPGSVLVQTPPQVSGLEVSLSMASVGTLRISEQHTSGRTLRRVSSPEGSEL